MDKELRPDSIYEENLALFAELYNAFYPEANVTEELLREFVESSSTGGTIIEHIFIMLEQAMEAKRSSKEMEDSLRVLVKCIKLMSDPE